MGPALTRTLHIVVMGVAGCGKSTVAEMLGDEFDLRLAEGDSFHPPVNIAKMSSGQPLTDDDRWPWLEALARWTGECQGAGQSTVVTCSALKRAYRDVLRGPVPHTLFLHLYGDEELLLRRMEVRDHFMPASLLRSQFEILEELQPDERGVAVDVGMSVHQLARQVIEVVRPHVG